MKEPIFFRRFDYDRALLPNSRLREMEEGVSTIEQAESRSGWSIGYPGWGLIYHVLLSHLSWSDENFILETGTNQGATTIVLAQALRDAKVRGHIHTVEIDRSFAATADANVRAAGLSDLVTIHCGDAAQILPDVVGSLPAVRAALLDGAHEHDQVMVEFETVLQKLEPTGIVLFDNTYPLTEPEKGEPARVHAALQTIRGAHGGNIVNLESVSWYTPGLAIWQR